MNGQRGSASYSTERAWPDTYLSPHIKVVSSDDESELRMKLLKEGRTDAHTAQDMRQRLLFMNMSFFGNSYNAGSSTAHYILCNANVNKNITFDIATIFGINRQNHLYKKYGAQLEKLRNIHSECSNYGNLLFIAIPKNKVNECVFLARPGGYRDTAKINEQQTDDVNLVYNTLCQKTAAVNTLLDVVEFCLAMTNDAGLNPHGGIVIQSINAADKEKYAAFKKEYDAVIQNMRKDMAKKRWSSWW